MSLYGNTDANTSAPKFAPSSVNLGNSQTNLDTLYANDNINVVSGQTVGVFGVAANEKQGTGNVASFTVGAAGDGAYGLPAVTVTGANTTQATATLNVKVVGVTIVTQGTGYGVGNTLFVHTGANTTRAVLTVTNIGAVGNITAVSISTAGKYSTLLATNNISFLANSASGSGFTANVRFGLESVTVNAAGQGYNRDTVGAAASANGIVNTAISVTLTGQEGIGALAGWNLRREGSGGRAGRVHYECLVAQGSITGDAADDAKLAE